MTQHEYPNLSLPSTQFSPSVEADWQAGKLLMIGESYPENTYEFFAQIIEWTEKFLGQEDRLLSVELQLSYLNTSSIRAMIDIFDLLQEASDSGKPVSVSWLYDSRNPRASELGEEFKEDYTFPFEISALRS
jgi:hypothetical protein